jgi:hypothetical protein
MNTQNIFNVSPPPYGTSSLPGSAIVAYKQNAWSPMIMGDVDTAERVMHNSNVRFGGKARKGRKSTRKNNRKSRKSRKNHRRN